MANMSFGSLTAQAQPIQPLFAQLQHQQSRLQQHTPQIPVVAPQPRRPAADGSWTEPSVEDITLQLRDPAVHTADLTVDLASLMVIIPATAGYIRWNNRTCS